MADSGTPAVYSKECAVIAERVFFDRKMSVPGIIAEFQDAVLRHSEEMKVDRKVIFPKFNAYWVISKLHLDIKSFPEVDEKIKVETWPLKPSFVVFEREAAVYRESGELCVSVSSEWCVVDGTTRRIRRSDSFEYPAFTHAARRFEPGYCRFASPETDDGCLRFSHTVGLNDLDMNVHMNNIAYVRLATDTLSMDEYTSRPVRAADVRFRSQMYFGEELLVYRKDDADRVFVTGKKRDGTVVFEVCFSF